MCDVEPPWETCPPIAASCVELSLREASGMAEIGAAEIGVLQIHARHIRVCKAGAREVGAARVCLCEPCALETSLRAGGVDQACAGQIGLREVSTGELGV